MSHEIRTPMNAILGFSELLRSQMAASKDRNYLDAITSSGRTLLALINDILDLSKIEAGKLELQYEPVSVARLVDEIQKLFSIKAGEKGLKLITEVDPKLPRGLMLDEVRLRQVLFNVVGNALKFTEKGQVTIRARAQYVAAGGMPNVTGISDGNLNPCPGGTSDNSPAFQRWVEVSCEVSPEGTAEEAPRSAVPSGLKAVHPEIPALKTLGYSHPPLRAEKAQILVASGGTPAATAEPDETRIILILEVSDTGIGIPKDQQEHIFGAFAQVSGQSTRKFGGTGLGLTITKRLTEMMRGKVEVQSESGKGSTFRFIFPNVEITELAQSDTLATDGQGDFSQFAPSTILVADDVALNRQLVAGYFEGTGHKLITATNGREAVEQAEKHRPDVILMDMRMPELDGYEATKRLKANPALKVIPVIAVTASSFREEEARARKACDGFIRKPFNRAELIAELKHFLKPAEAAATPIDAAKAATRETPVSAEALAKRPGLLVKLQEEERTIWPGVCQRMEIGEVEEFALRLKSWGEEGAFEALQKYAAALMAQVEAFDVDRLPTTLRDFPSVCRASEECVKTIA